MTGSSSTRHYPRAPITEAVIDLRVRFAHERGEVAQRLDALKQHVARDFPIAQPLRHFEVQVEIPNSYADDGVSTKKAAAQIGWRMSKADTSRVLKVDIGGFTFAHLAPYTSWEVFEPECRELWKAFLTICEPQQVQRIATRYINRILVPEDSFDPQKYFQIFPHVPASLDAELSGVFMQVQLVQHDLNALASVTVAAMTKERKGESPILLDIDVFAVRDIAPSSQEIWTALNEFRDRKNLLFEAMITDESRRLFE